MSNSAGDGTPKRTTTPMTAPTTHHPTPSNAPAGAQPANRWVDGTEPVVVDIA
jgi:hypothetical protein